MTRLRVLVVDDEAAARERLMRMLADLGVEIAGEAANGLAALDQTARLRPDVLLLDIEMPEISGLDVARRLTEPRPLIVFQTAFGEYALDAFEREALDYLLKPITRERLGQTMERVRARLLSRAGAVRVTEAMALRLEASLGHAARPHARRFLVRHQAGHRLVALSDIDRFEATEGLVYALVNTVRYGVDDSLDQLERRFTGTFIRTSRSDLIAMDRIDAVKRTGDGSLILKLKDGTAHRVTRRRSAAIRAALNG